MSLKKFKNKSKLMEDQIDHFELSPFKSCIYWWNSYYFYDGYDDDDDWYDRHNDYCDCEACVGYDYTYVENINKFSHKVLSKTGRWIVSEPYQHGNYIDMESIYGKVGKRNRRIDIVLGLLVDDKYVPTIGDLYPNLK